MWIMVIRQLIFDSKSLKKITIVIWRCPPIQSMNFPGNSLIYSIQSCLLFWKNNLLMPQFVHISNQFNQLMFFHNIYSYYSYSNHYKRNEFKENSSVLNVHNGYKTANIWFKIIEKKNNFNNAKQPTIDVPWYHESSLKYNGSVFVKIIIATLKFIYFQFIDHRFRH